jgi:Lon protease-like protein
MAANRTYAQRVTSALPLFPLGTVLFPGLVLPLHIFEERYRELIRTLLRRSEPNERAFGVVAIRRGWEVEHSSDTVSLYDVGCTAEIREVTEHPDGTFDIVTVGRRRYSITEMLPTGTPYLRAQVSYLPEQPGPAGDADQLGPRVIAAFRAYLRAVRLDASDEQLPDDPQVLSHLVAATASLSLADRQTLLATPDTATRLRKELVLLHREIGLLSQVRAVPVSLSDLQVRPGPN